MPILESRQQLQMAIRANYAKLKRELAEITPEMAASMQMKGHAKNTSMSISNLLAYLTGWGRLVLKWNTRLEKCQPVDFPDTGFKWNQLGKLAQKFYDDYKEKDYTSLLSELDSVFEQIEFLVERKTNDELYAAGWYGKWTLGRMI